MRKAFALATAVVLVASIGVLAQDTPASTPKPAKIIFLTREDIKIGKMPQHDNLMRQIRRNAESTNSPLRWIAGRAVSGNPSETIVVGLYDSFADVEKGRQAFTAAVNASLQNADFALDSVESHLGNRGIIAQLREDLSYRPEKINTATATAWEMTVIKLKPGTSRDFADIEKTAVELHRKANIDEQWLVYEVQFGMHSPSFLVFAPLKSLADLDVDRKAVHEEVFTPTVRRQFASIARDSILSEESTLISVRPEISRPADTIVAANPDFWTVKDAEPVVAAKGKGRKPVVEPASLKKEEKK
ncbi:MAG: hypothetical protein L0Z53_22635 [Acidobacteriales bacterium]|nr:hypothetical protein [Terriglobales bacterium]